MVVTGLPLKHKYNTNVPVLSPTILVNVYLLTIGYALEHQNKFLTKLTVHTGNLPLFESTAVANTVKTKPKVMTASSTSP